MWLEDPTTKLEKAAHAAYGDIPTIIERDNNLPGFDELESERQMLARNIYGQ